jgi:hypothetical protein
LKNFITWLKSLFRVLQNEKLQELPPVTQEEVPYLVGTSTTYPTAKKYVLMEEWLEDLRRDLGPTRMLIGLHPKLYTITFYDLSGQAVRHADGASIYEVVQKLKQQEKENKQLKLFS